MEIYDVVVKLVGPIIPVGETQTDAKRLENLKVLTKLTNTLLIDIDSIARDNKDRVEYSRKKVGEFAAKFLKEWEIEQ